MEFIRLLIFIKIVVVKKISSWKKNMIISSNVIEVIRPISTFLFFFYEEILHTKKSIKSEQTTSTQIYA